MVSASTANMIGAAYMGSFGLTLLCSPAATYGSEVRDEGFVLTWPLSRLQQRLRAFVPRTMASCLLLCACRCPCSPTTRSTCHAVYRCHAAVLPVLLCTARRSYAAAPPGCPVPYAFHYRSLTQRPPPLRRASCRISKRRLRPAPPPAGSAVRSAPC